MHKVKGYFMKWIFTTVILATKLHKILGGNVQDWLYSDYTTPRRQLYSQHCSNEKQFKTLKNLITAGDDITPINYNVQ